jgi:hypothetical protein
MMSNDTRAPSRACVRAARGVAACVFRSRVDRPHAFAHAWPPFGRAVDPLPTGAQMNPDDSSRLPLAGAPWRIVRSVAPRAPASVSAVTESPPIARDATRRAARVRR